MWNSGRTSVFIAIFFVTTQIWYNHERLDHKHYPTHSDHLSSCSFISDPNVVHSSIFLYTKQHLNNLSCCKFSGGKFYLIYLCALSIAQSSDCHPNPGPNKTNTNIEYPCFVCGNEVLDNESGIQCDGCDCWYHTTCINMNNETYSLLSKTNISWICAKCSSINTTTSSILENSIIIQPSYYGVLSDEDPSLSGTPISTSTPTKGKQNNLNTNTNQHVSQ